MPAPPAIKVENLGKRYRLGAREAGYRTFRETVTDAVQRLNPFSRPGIESAAGGRNEIWALKGVSLEIRPGEVVGIIGRNGAGKSTLLKILSRITEPTEGRAEIYGRVGSLLEVGTGFHPELTGRENLYLNGAILGMRRAEIERHFAEIVAFAEVEKFIDTPVKRYSSGMYLRLAFAVAAHLEPEILLVDEVLAVGDAAFQKKCLGKMKDVAEQGRTVLFVSHNMTALQSLCGRAVWLERGRVVADGETSKVVAGYLQTTAAPVLEQTWEDPSAAPGNDQVRLRRARLSLMNGDSSNVITVRTPLRIEFEYWNFVPDAELNLSLHLYNLEGLCIFNSGSGAVRCQVGLLRGICQIPGDFLNDGTYRIMIMIVKDQSVAIYSHQDVIVFDVQDVEREGGWFGKWLGAVRPKLEWHTEFVGTNRPAVIVKG